MSKINKEEAAVAPEKENFHVGQKAIIFDPVQQLFLFVEHQKDREDSWGFIGGRIDKDEEADEALKREIREEAGKDIQYDIIGVVDREAVGAPEDKTMMLGFLVLYRGGELTLSEEHSTYKWLTAEEIVAEKTHRPWVKRFVVSALDSWKNHGYLEDLKRLQADFENYKKRQAESQKELGGYLIEKLLLDIIPVLDNFRAATMHVPPAEIESPWVVGIQYIEKQLEDVIKQNGVAVIAVEAGDTFDPMLHEAVSHEAPPQKTEADAESKQPVVASVLQKGFKIGDKVIRPAKVSIK